MNKLEEKLIELGYKKPTDLPIINTHELSPNIYIKIIDSVYAIYIKLDNNNIEYYDVRYQDCSVVTRVYDEIYKSALMILNKDLEELRKYEERRKKTKLGEKLKELGYYEDTTYPGIYKKSYKNTFVYTEIDCEYKRYSNPIKIKKYCMYVHHFIYQTISKDDILNALKAYDEMEKDLEELRKYED